MDFKFGLLLIVSAQICTTLALPPCVCTRNLSPVCGSDGVTYNNQCLLNCAAHQARSQITQTRSGPCEGSSPPVGLSECVCTLNYSPVCGSDGQDYPNECTLDCQKSKFNPSLKVENQGPCKTPSQPIAVCPLIENPVCGTDGNTYGNDCMLNAASKDNSRLAIAHSGACDDSVKVVDI